MAKIKKTFVNVECKTLDLHFVECRARVQDKYKKTRTVPQNFTVFFSKTILTQFAYTCRVG